MRVTNSSQSFRLFGISTESFARFARDVETRLAALPIGTYLVLIVVAIGLSLLLSGDFGESWDITYAELRGRAAYDFYFNGFDSGRFNATVPVDSRYYGPMADLLITIAQQGTSDAVQRFEIRTLLQALISLSCLIPVFLIAARVVSKPLALVAVILVAATPVLFGHAFINAKDSMFASAFLWALYLILVCFEGGRRPGYAALVALGLLLGVITSIRYLGAYLFVLLALAAIVLPALQFEDRGRALDGVRTRTLAHAGGAAILLVAFAIGYVLSMPALLADLQAQTVFDIIGKFANYPWPGRVLYFGDYYRTKEIPWHYLYGYMFVQLPLYYHLFLVTLLAAIVAMPRATLTSFRTFLKSDCRAATTIILLIVALVIPPILILVMRPALYDTLRHVLFLLPILCLLLYFAFLAILAKLPRIASVALCVLAVLCVGEAVRAAVRLHPYEYTYYNPLVKPQGKFELDYWATSFREVAERLNDYARDYEGEKIAVAVCGPPHNLATFLDADHFEVVTEKGPPKKLSVLLNRFGCLSFLRGEPLITVRRGGAILAVVGRVDPRN